jgi:hypothetical protein
MARIKHIAHPISDRALQEPKNMTSEDVLQALSQQREDSMNAASSRSHDDSLGDTSDSGSESWSCDSKDTTSKSDSSKCMKVVAAVAAAGITFDFSISKVGRMHVVAMETHTRYFRKGYCWVPSMDIVLMPQAKEAVVFEDLFSVGLRMPPHSVLVEIL